MDAQVIKPASIKPLSRGVLEITKYVDGNDQISVATVKINGNDGTTTDTVSDTFDFVVEGSGNFVIDGVKHELSKATWYLYQKARRSLIQAI